MTFFKNKYFLPVCLVGVLAGYGAAEYLMPRYFHPTQETKITTIDLLAALGAQQDYYRQTASGNYLAGQYAQRHKDWDKASDFMGRVLAEDKDNLDLQKHAMVLYMASGQINQAVDIANKVLSETDDNLLAVLFAALGEFKKEDYLSASKTLEEIQENTIATFIVPALKLWADSAKGSFNTSALEKNSFYAYHAMLAAKYLNRGNEAVDYALGAFDVDGIDIRDVEKTADLFVKLGETDQALKLYNAVVERGFTSPDITQKISYLEKDISIDKLLKIQNIKTPKEGAAIVFLDMAEILLREYSDDSATIFAQMALALNPTLEEAHMIIGNILTRHDRYEEAITQFQKIKKEGEFYNVAQRQIAELYAEQKEPQKAIDILSNLYESDNDIEALIQAGDIYRYEEDFTKAVEVYNRVIALWEETPEEYWHVLYARGMAYERLKEFKKSEIDLKKALEFRPNHPYLLNYLGYSWADQGIHLDKAMSMIKEAALAKPDDGYIADSLGWVYYKLNDFNSAVIHLERAVELLPYDATLNDHLGDAYWRAGRKIEAKFQWQRAANYSEKDEAELKTTIEEKLANGLPPLSATTAATSHQSTVGVAQEEHKAIKEPAL